MNLRSSHVLAVLWALSFMWAATSFTIGPPKHLDPSVDAGTGRDASREPKRGWTNDSYEYYTEREP